MHLVAWTLDGIVYLKLALLPFEFMWNWPGVVDRLCVSVLENRPGTASKAISVYSI